MRTYSVLIAACVLLAVLAVPAAAVSISLGGGLDPTGLTFASIVSEAPVGQFFGLRAELSIALANDIAGLMLVSGGGFVHYPAAPFDPFLGAGIGAALTPNDYSLGFIVEGVAGSHIALFAPVSAFVDIRYIVRFTSEAITAGPLYEAGLSVSF
jgi:hypothetical protein